MLLCRLLPTPLVSSAWVARLVKYDTVPTDSAVTARKARISLTRSEQSPRRRKIRCEGTVGSKLEFEPYSHFNRRLGAGHDRTQRRWGIRKGHDRRNDARAGEQPGLE